MTSAREEVEKQTDAFMNLVLSNFIPLINDLNLAPINHVVSLLIQRPASLPFVAKSQPGIALLTALCSHAAHLKHPSGDELTEPIPQQDLKRWYVLSSSLRKADYL